MQFSFGSGALYGIPASGADRTPVRFGALQGVNIDLSFTQAEIHDMGQFPTAIGRGIGGARCSAETATIDARLFNEVFFGVGLTAGTVQAADAEVHTIAGGQAVATHAGQFIDDLGVLSFGGTVLDRVAGTPVGYEYACDDAGTYTFAAGFDGLQVQISYTYRSGEGNSLDLDGIEMGTMAQFTAVLNEKFQGKEMTIILGLCLSSKLQLAPKFEEFAMQNFDFEAYADASGLVGSIHLEEGFDVSTYFWTPEDGSDGGVTMEEGSQVARWDVFGAATFIYLRSIEQITAPVYCEFEMTEAPEQMTFSFGVGAIPLRTFFEVTAPFDDHVDIFSGNGGCSLPAAGYVDGTAVVPSAAYTIGRGTRVGIAADPVTRGVWFRRNGAWVTGDPGQGAPPSATVPGAGPLYFVMSAYACNIIIGRYRFKAYPDRGSQRAPAPAGFGPFYGS